MAEELNKPTGLSKPATQNKIETNVGNGDMANLIGNMGILIDSTIESVQGIITTVSSATGQLIEGVTSTINSEPVKGIINNVNTVSGQLIEGVASTLNSEQVQSSFNELGKLWKNILVNLNATVSSNQVQNLFDNVSSGLGQLVANVFSSAPKITGNDGPKRTVTQIPFGQKDATPAVKIPETVIKTKN
ncbi:MAG: chlorosome envelope protein H [Chlorobiaceae bacterium]